MLDIMVGMYGTPSICLGKLSFGQILGKTAWLIRLLHFQNAITSKPLGCFFEYFCMKLKCHEGNKQKILGVIRVH